MLCGKSITLIGIDGRLGDEGLRVAMEYSSKIFPVFDDSIVIEKSMTTIECQEFTVKDLSSYVTTDYALIVQGDGFISNPERWNDEFMSYDYIGAPWGINPAAGNPHMSYAEGENVECLNAVGNGGFSLRSKKFLELSSALTYDGHSPEDAFLCVKKFHELSAAGAKFAPTKLATTFSTDPYAGDSFGFHGGISSNELRVL